jgi:hypothetical protein
MIADDYKAISDRAADIRARPKWLPETCPKHAFGDQGRCVNCGLHHFHLPALSPTVSVPPTA